MNCYDEELITISKTILDDEGFKKRMVIKLFFRS